MRVSGDDGFPFPWRYKRGKPKSDGCDEVQLCGQAMCLEEMLGCAIENGALYYGSQHKRHDVAFDETLRSETSEMSRRLHELIGKGITPPAHYEKRCDRCSLFDICVPEAGKKKSVGKYLDEMLEVDNCLTSSSIPLLPRGDGE